METVDARGMACPRPVILARRAMQAGQPCLVVVDDDVSLANVSRMARAAGWEVQIEERSDGAYISLARQGEAVAAPAERPAHMTPAGGAIVVFLASDAVGQGDEALGRVLMRSFLHTLQEVEPLPEAIVCMNSGVRLAATGSPVVEDLQALADRGVQVLLCGTCLDYYHLKSEVAVGTISNMYTLAEMLLGAGRVVRM